MALDDEAKVYSWGENGSGECGDGSTARIHRDSPKLIEKRSGYKVDYIKSGFNHCYCKTVCGKHYLWSSNNDGECTLDKTMDVEEPFKSVWSVCWLLEYKIYR